MLSSRTSRRDLMRSLMSVGAVVAAMSAQRAIADDPETVATVLQPFVVQRELAGAVVLVADKDKVLALESVGFADIAGQRPMSAGSAFWIASQTKPMTAAAVMQDTTFWPNEEQAARVARSYRPNAEKTGLEEFAISQLIYPLSDRTHRFPMPAGGLFSTAHDTARFCRMLLNNGELDGQCILTESAVLELSKRQTPESMKESYGLGFSVSPDSFGHGGAHATNMDIRLKDGLVLIWMIQHAGFPGDGNTAHPMFKNWAVKRFGK